MKNYFNSSKTNSSWLFYLKFPVLALLAILTLSACRTDDDEEIDIPENTIVGIWQPYKLSQNATLSSGPYVNDVAYTSCQQRGRIIFNMDGTATAKTYGETGGSCVLQDESNFSYTFNPVTMEFSITDAAGIKQTGLVRALSDSELVYEVSGTYTFQGEPNVKVTTMVTARRAKD